MSHALKAAVARQRILLHDRLRAPMTWLAAACVDCWGRRDVLEQRLRDGLDALPFCKYLYVLDASARQVTGNLSPGGPLPEHVGRDRRHRPYLAQALSGAAFSLSDAYISRNARRPSLTAIQRIDGAGRRTARLSGCRLRSPRTTAHPRAMRSTRAMGAAQGRPVDSRRPVRAAAQRESDGRLHRRCVGPDDGTDRGARGVPWQAALLQFPRHRLGCG